MCCQECLKPIDYMAEGTEGLGERMSRSERASLSYADQIRTLESQHQAALDRISALEEQNRQLSQRNEGYKKSPPMTMPAAD